MDVTVRLFAGLRERVGADTLVLRDVPEDVDMGGLKGRVEALHPELGSLGYVRGVLGTEYVTDDTRIGSGREVSLLPPVSGGSSSTERALEQGVFEIHADVLHPEECHARVAHPSCGAVVVFTGTTREHNRERDVVRLDYEAFSEMAGAEMERIFAECLEQFGAPDDPTRRLRMICQHRTGTVGVGEPSVVIAVASPHRDSAFKAARFLIDELKARVPLWKKELYRDGEHWIGERS